MVSIIIPVYNEEKIIADCLDSLAKQSFKEFEVIVVDDGSTDKTYEVLSKLPVRVLRQKHLGPAVARNSAVKHAKGNILVFVDADMTFEKDFIKKLIAPIKDGKSKGTFTKEEYVSNWDNVWARCWNYNEGIVDNRRIPKNYPDTSPVFRAILKSEFKQVSGFDDIGFTDDWTLSRKLGFKATFAPGAICYHRNPDALIEVYTQSRWIGKNEFITGTIYRKIISLVRFNLLLQTIRGLFISIKYKEAQYLVFQFFYYLGINFSIFRSFFGEVKSK
ncbi:glycosyltransferase family 2 protein [Candidatus Gottesmanbacteria bacterium]|nr:glycosyltransferase family 2 protein [Candidatus Gottesmanbacteria bacterium]